MSSSSIAATAAADDRVLHRRFDDALTALPTAGVDYATLTRVDVCYCKLTSIAALVGGGGAPAPLVAFVARHNQLDDSGVALLSRITTLQVVHLDGNQLTRVDFVERLTSLRELSLNANQLVTLPRLPPRLESLQAAENQLTSVDELTLRDAVSALRTLALPKNKLRALPWATLAHATALERLVLHRNELGALDECVARLTRLQLLDVRENAPLLRLPHAVAEMRRNARALVELPPSMQQQLSFQLATSLPDLVLFDELDALVARSRSLSRRLMIGDAVCAANLPCLQANGVSHVLNAAADLRPAHIDAFSQYKHFLMLDGEFEDLLHYVPLAFEFADEAFSQQSAVLLVHCRQGASRSAALVLAIMMRELARARCNLKRAVDDPPLLDAAFGALRRCRPLVHPNAGFLRQLRELATLLAAIDAADDGDANDRRVLHALRQRRARPAMLPNGQLALYDESASTVGSGGGGTDDFVDDNNDDDEASKNDFTCTLQ